MALRPAAPPPPPPPSIAQPPEQALDPVPGQEASLYGEAAEDEEDDFDITLDAQERQEEDDEVHDLVSPTAFDHSRVRMLEAPKASLLRGLTPWDVGGKHLKAMHCFATRRMTLRSSLTAQKAVPLVHPSQPSRLAST